MKETSRQTLLFAAAAVVVCATPLAWSQQPTSPSIGASGVGSKVPAMPRTDANFMKQAAENGHAEVEAGKVALQKASDPAVKKFAQQMVDDHTKVGDELKALASSKGVELPAEPSLVQKGKMKVLGTTDGNRFDRHYVGSMGVAAHVDTVKLFRKAAADANDPDVKAFARKTVPGLEHHLEMAKTLDASVKVTGKNSSK
jgi:putative membrane protein